MKRLIISAGIITIFVFAALFRTHQSAEETYLKNISKHHRHELDGPEKSAFRDALMTMNPITGEIPTKNIKETIRNVKSGRSAADRDFKWTQVDTEIAGRARAIMVDPNNAEKLWLGAVTGGLWYNSDFRNNADWVPVSDDWESLSISSIAHDPNNPQVFYVGTGESFTSVNIYRESTSSGVGIYKTTDAGSTWTLLSSTTDFQYVNDIVVRNEGGTSVVYAGVASGIYQGRVFGSTPSDGLYRSTDGGSSWAQVLPNIEGSTVPYSVSDIEIVSNGDLYVGTMRNLELKGGGVILSSSDGINWETEDRFAVNITEELLNDYGFEAYPGRVRIASGGDMIYVVGTAGWLNNFQQIRDWGGATRMMYKEGATGWVDLDGPPSNWASIPWHALAFSVDPSDDNHLVVGGLDVHALSNAREAGSLSWVHLSDWASMYYFSDYLITYYGLNNIDSIKNHFVHADIHSILFTGSSDEVVVSTDGGVQYSADFTKGFATLEGERLNTYPTFGHINNSLATTQYYTIALHPEKGNMEVLAGSQDNSTHTTENGSITYESMIGGGDGAYCFFDRDDPDLRISSSQSNAYNIWIGNTGHFYGLSSGTFINPAAYDDRSNLLYVNMAVDGGYEALITGIQGRFLDTLGIINVNEPLGKDMLGLQARDTIKLGTNSTAAFSALKISPYDDELNATMILGNQLGDVFKITGLPYSPSATKIDKDQLPVGYISAVDIGSSNDELLVSFSNYGVTSVWYTDDGGTTWQNIERDLPDIPVRDAKFNPYDSDKVLIATELGVWGLESIELEEEGWKAYNEGLPNVRIDMMQIRKSDSVIALATHGRGVFTGKFDQGAVVKPVANFDVIDKVYKINEPIDFDASGSLSPEGDLTYAWDFGDGNTGAGINVTHAFEESGLFNVTLTVTSGSYSDSETKQVMVEPLGLKTKSLNVYPNPTFGAITFDFEVAEAEVYTLGGNLLIRANVVNNQLDLSTLQKGIYFIHSKSNSGEIRTFKVIKK
ncbi:Por secretion system C-terminal sorting domain-containing protein [Ekhidna lutea]|uniref:Por secretion system C-terminal sorting domain-containing protein n=1 Tax=Ekhidna lutea TaxID=447679 RepID=A0A239ELJ8_EKHLU|nr:PKD domain-containing protein [Ekhidna lutea]SNS45650.1 Por secretion system C-terminal sorting domain-containing protein [Ekhidna lutea]